MESTRSIGHYQKEWRRTHKEHTQQYSKDWYADPVNRARKKEYERQRNEEIRKRCLDHYGGKCVCCGEEREVFLQLDHIEENGAEHKRKLRITGSRLFSWLLSNNFPPEWKLQVLCANCHAAKTKNGRCWYHPNPLDVIAGPI